MHTIEDPALMVLLLVIAVILIGVFFNQYREQSVRRHRVNGSQIRAATPTQSTQPRIVTSFYRTKDGQEDYAFSFEQQSDGKWRAYITRQPDYKGRPAGGHATHRYTDGDRKFICWTLPLTTVDMAKQVAALWADATQEYIKTGKPFGE